MGDSWEISDVCPTPKRDAIRAIAMFLEEAGFEVRWIVWAEEFRVINWDVEHMFWVFFEDGMLCMRGPAWSGLRYNNSLESVISPSMLNRRFFELADPRCFDQVVRVLRRPSRSPR